MLRLKAKVSHRGKYIARKVDSAKKRELFHFGAFAIKTSRRSMKPVPKRANTRFGEFRRIKSGAKQGQFRFVRGLHSRPGTPPNYRDRTRGLRLQAFDVNLKRGSVKFGPIRFAGGSRNTTKLATEVNEFGGQQVIRTRRGARPFRAMYKPRPFVFPAGEKATNRLRKRSRGMIQ